MTNTWLKITTFRNAPIVEDSGRENGQKMKWVLQRKMHGKVNESGELEYHPEGCWTDLYTSNRKWAVRLYHWMHFSPFGAEYRILKTE